MADDGFHPDLQQSERVARNRVHHVKSSEIDADAVMIVAAATRIMFFTPLWYHAEPAD